MPGDEHPLDNRTEASTADQPARGQPFFWPVSFAGTARRSDTNTDDDDNSSHRVRPGKAATALMTTTTTRAVMIHPTA